MEQKHLDEMEEDSFLGEELVDDDSEDYPILKVEDKKKEKKTTVKPKVFTPTVKKKELSIDDDLFNDEEVKIKPARVEALRKAELPKEIKEVREQKEAKEIKEVKVTPLASASPSNDPDNVKKSSEAPRVESPKTTPCSSFWKWVSFILIIVLAVSIYTNGFGLIKKGSNTTATLSLSQAEEKLLTYVNTKLLRAPLVAEVSAREDQGDLYKFILSVAGQTVDTYMTKDGRMFFPQALALNLTSNNSLANGKLEVSIDDDAIKGNINALVTIVEFSDYECPFCGKFYNEVLPELDRTYIKTGKLRFVFRDFPLDIHPNSQKAAEAAECAGAQNRYWEMHNKLYENQAKLSLADLKNYAQQIGLNVTKFNTCLDSGAMTDEVAKDLADGKEYGVSGTPAFFINGKLISGAQPFSVFKQEIDAALGTEAPQPTTAPTPAPKPNERSALNTTAVGSGNNAPINNTSTNNTPPSTTSTANTSPVTAAPAINISNSATITAKRWLFNPNTLTVKAGEKVKLTIQSGDLTFTFAIPELGVESNVSGNTLVEFTPSRAGSYKFTCSSCESWRGMEGLLVVK